MRLPVPLSRFRRLAACLLLAPLLLPDAGRAAGWTDALGQRIDAIDRGSPGTLGVYVKRLDNNEAYSHGADKRWYLGSTVKVPVAVAVLQEVDAGRLALSERLVLAEEDKVDGSGQLVWSAVGTGYTVDSLITRMLTVSDNTAANLLIRRIGIDTLNRSARAAMGAKSFERFTDFEQIRYDVYAELHPDARKLSNRQLVEIAAAPVGPRRLEALQRALKVDDSDLRAKTFDEAYDRYYAHGLNQATLEGYGAMLEKLVRGQLLSPASTKRLFTAMKFGTPGNYRLEAGLPKSVKFMHKTGTQYRRACHVGVVNPQDGGARAIVVATCAADLDDQKEAGGVFQQVGRAISEVLLPAR
ncbi:serine hydrolase [uncultured Xylophilus sp.]|uniref:serine hydrolase n=1 Tax=uncultured Xylophilus sp. TaxID=296832 RepID=UPI0025D77B9A|nr:serine hydrolase [uncultured Xylophilus sp.]